MFAGLLPRNAVEVVAYGRRPAGLHDDHGFPGPDPDVVPDTCIHPGGVLAIRARPLHRRGPCGLRMEGMGSASAGKNSAAGSHLKQHNKGGGLWKHKPDHRRQAYSLLVGEYQK